MRKTQHEQMFSAVLPTADIRHCMSKAKRRTLMMPACITVDVTGRVEPSVNATSVPSAPVMNFSTIAVGRIRSPSPVAVTS
jgi:hypothetical protein